MITIFGTRLYEILDGFSYKAWFGTLGSLNKKERHLLLHYLAHHGDAIDLMHLQLANLLLKSQ